AGRALRREEAVAPLPRAEDVLGDAGCFAESTDPDEHIATLHPRQTVGKLLTNTENSSRVCPEIGEAAPGNPADRRNEMQTVTVDQTQRPVEGVTTMRVAITGASGLVGKALA